MPIHDVETRQVNWPYLTRWAQADTAQQPVLLAGQGNLEELAAHLAQLVVCEAGSACGTCPACRHFLHGSHPDVISVTLAGGEAGIKALREVLQQLNIHPTGERRAVTIHAIDAVSLPAANILLKSLEEPAVSTRWILTTRYPRRLLATILSRCQRVNANPSQPPFIKGGQNPLLDKGGGKGEDSLHRLATVRDEEELPTEELAAIEQQLIGRLRSEGPTPKVRRAFQRLRDYYKIRALKGNEKLAREVLYASLP